MHAAGLADFSGPMLIVFGLASMLAAATFILKQTEYKRMLAYSSIENMGIIAFGTGIGGMGAYGAMHLPDSPQPDQIQPFSHFRKYSAGIRQPADRRHRQPGPADAENLRGLFRRLRRHFRVSALWHFSSVNC
jgi:hypothetical protein